MTNENFETNLERYKIINFSVEKKEPEPAGGKARWKMNNFTVYDGNNETTVLAVSRRHPIADDLPRKRLAL